MVEPSDIRDVASVDAVASALAGQDYLADEGLATAVYLALRLRRPLLLEGEAGVGKTEVARALAAWSGGELIRLQCYEGIDASQAVYEWDYSRQLLHLRAVEASGAATGSDVAEITDELYDERFLVRRPLLRSLSAVDGVPPVLLRDEVVQYLEDATVAMPPSSYSTRNNNSYTPGGSRRNQCTMSRRNRGPESGHGSSPLRARQSYT